jgi:hypothetical protein
VIGFTPQGEEFALVLAAPGLQVIDGVNEQLSEPTAPILKDPETNNPIPKRDKDGNVEHVDGQVLFQRNTNDPAYKKAKTRHQRANAIALFYVMCKDQLSPTKSIEDFKGDWEAFYLHVWKDIEDAGAGIEKFNELSSTASALLAPMNSAEVEEARKVLGTDKETDAAVREKLKAEGKAPPQGKPE